MVAAVALLLGCAGAAARAQPAPIVLDADTTEVDRRNGHVVFTEVRIQQEDVVVRADRAESRDLDFADSAWQFAGNVRISTGMGDIESSTAEISFRNHRLASAVARGGPAQFRREMTDGDRRTVTGSAERIEFDTRAGQIELTGQAVVRDGAREVSGGRLLYRLAEDRLIASSAESGDDRVRIVIVPPGEEPAPPDEDAGEERP